MRMGASGGRDFTESEPGQGQSQTDTFLLQCHLPSLDPSPHGAEEAFATLSHLLGAACGLGLPLYPAGSQEPIQAAVPPLFQWTPK